MDAKFDDEKSLVKQEDECIRTLFHLVPDIGILLIVRARRIDFYDEKPLPRLRVSIIFPPHSFLHPILRLFSRWIRVRRIILSFHFRETSLKKGKKERNRCSRSRLFSVYELLRELGGYLPPKSIAPADITPLVSRLLRVNGAPLFDFFVDVDLYDRSRSSVFLDLPTKRQEDAFFAENPVSVSPPQHNLFTHAQSRSYIYLF